MTALRALHLVGLLAWTAVAPASAQSGIVVGVRVGAERYALNDVRDWQEAERAELARIGVSAEAPDAFPAYLTFGAEVSMPTWRGHRAGLSVRYGSTGGRLAYADYSGAVRADWVVVRRSVGVLAEQRFGRGRTAGVLALHALADHGTVRFEASTRLYEESVVDRLPDLHAWSVSAEPEVGVERLFGPVAVRLRAGVGVSFGGTLRLDGERVGLPGSSSASTLQWLGWRSGLTVAYAL